VDVQANSTAMKTKAKTYAVLTCDIVVSRHIEEFRRKRDQKLHHNETARCQEMDFVGVCHHSLG
jgi:hypothetical protein